MNRSLFSGAAVAALLAAARPVSIIGSIRADAGAGGVEKLLADVKAELERISSDVKKTAEEALRQSKDTGQVAADTKKQADALLTAQTQLSGAMTKLEDKLQSLETRNHDLEQQLAARRPGGAEAPKSIGAQVVDAAGYKAFLAAGCRGSQRIEVKQAITSATTSAGDLIVPDRETAIIGMPRRRMTIRQLLTPGRTGSNMVEYAKMVTRTNAAAVVTEGGTKPESNYEWDKADAPVRTIAHWVNVSRQAMEDAAQLQSEIDGELRYGLDLTEELELLKGDGTGQHLSGLVTEATDYSAAFAVTGQTMIDVLRLALLQASLAEYDADGIVLHPTDWARIELTKDGEFRYLFANVMQLTGPSLWGKPVVPTQSMDADEFLVGSFRAAGTIYDRMDAEVLISSEHSDNFVKNMLTVRAEKRLAMAVKRPAALITGDFGNVSE